MAPSIRQYESDYYSTGSEYSHDSEYSRSTAPTSYGPESRPSFRRYETASPTCGDYDANVPWACDPRASTETYASTIPSEDDVVDDLPEYEVPEYHPETYHHDDPIACTPPEFADLFPSSRRLRIAHDDTTEDGNMNLRIDTKVPTSGGRKRDFTLFHLRMHDLKRREFSLRRYSRDSGREVCHSTRKYTKPAVERRPGLQRSVSNALANFRGKQDMRDLASMSLKRHDSGYESDELEVPEMKSAQKDSRMPLPTNTTKLEFSNYSQVHVKRRGAKSSKRYEFEYWGSQYSWKRVAKKGGNFCEISYQLVNPVGTTLAQIVPEPLTTAQARAEEAKGGWVAPCCLWITDNNVCGGSTDLADVIVATGLIALVDDSIKRRFHSKRSVQIVLPIPSKSPLKVDTVGPKRLIDEVFHRRTPSSQSKHPTPLRHASARV
ncbi:MAG: hypothetical protein M1833_004059 [Piccolia ochrophora]|nr:MAG: hypothetical protein M1833_004059 [Piccolia ochrophora]